MTAADSKSMEDRIAVLEERTDEWQSTLRVRIQGADKLSARGLELAKGSKEFWKLKSETVDLLLEALDPLLPPCSLTVTSGCRSAMNCGKFCPFLNTSMVYFRLGVSGVARNRLTCE